MSNQNPSISCRPKTISLPGGRMRASVRINLVDSSEVPLAEDLAVEELIRLRHSLLDRAEIHRGSVHGPQWYRNLRQLAINS